MNELMHKGLTSTCKVRSGLPSMIDAREVDVNLKSEKCASIND